MTNQTTTIWETVKRKISSLRRSRDYSSFLSDDFLEDDEDLLQGFEESDDLFE